MALTDAQAKIIAANKKKKNKGNSFVDDFESKKQKRPSSSSLPVVTPTKTVKNEVTTPLKQGKPATKRKTTRITANHDFPRTYMPGYYTDAVGRHIDGSNRLYPAIDIIRDRIAKKETAQTLAYLARVRGEGTRKERYESWQEALQKAAEERVKRQEKLKAYTLSEQDSGLPLSHQQMVREAKAAWEKAKKAGDTEGMRKAHEKAEAMRMESGYSGGVTGDEYLPAKLTKKDEYHLNQVGRNKLKKAMLDRQKAIEAGDVQAQMAASYEIQRIRNDAQYKNKADSVDGHGRPVENHTMTAEELKEAEHRFQEGLYSTMAAVPGSVLSFLETTNQAIDNDVVERNRAYLQEKANRLNEYRIKLEMVRNGEGNPAWGSESWLEQQVRIAENAKRLLSQGTNVDPNLPGQTLMRKSGEAAAEALKGVEGWKRDLAGAAMAVGQNIPALALTMIPGVGTALGLGLMGTQAAGSRAWELNEQNSDAAYLASLNGGNPEDYGAVDPAEASFRGLLSGLVEAGTGFIPLGRLTKLLKGKGGQNFLKNVLEQMGLEGAEEGAAYTANFLLDKAYQDPNAAWTPEDLWQNVKLGALAGGMMAGGGSVVGGMVNRTPPVPASVLPRGDTEKKAGLPTAEEADRQQRAARAENDKRPSRREQTGWTGADGQSPGRAPHQSAALTASPQGEALLARVGLPGVEGKPGVGNRQGVTELERSGILAGAEAGTIRQVGDLARKLNREVRFFRGESWENGKYDPNTGILYLNTNGRDPVMQTFAHELTHSIEQADSYDKLAEAILNSMDEAELNARFQEITQRYQEKGVFLEDPAEVMNEVVAEYVETRLLTDYEAISSLVQTDRSLGQRILAWIDSMLAKLGSTAAQERAALTEARGLYARALQETSKGGGTMERETPMVPPQTPSGGLTRAPQGGTLSNREEFLTRQSRDKNGSDSPMEGRGDREGTIPQSASQTAPFTQGSLLGGDPEAAVPHPSAWQEEESGSQGEKGWEDLLHDPYMEALGEQLRTGEISEEEFDRLFDEYYHGGSEVFDYDTEESPMKYSFAGRKAKTADLDALRKAQEMDAMGVAGETIRRDTGWFRGAVIRGYHTEEQRRVIREYNAAVDKDLLEYVEDVIEHPDTYAPDYRIGEVTPRAADDILRLTGVDTSGFDTIMKKTDVAHILKRHGKTGKQDQSMSDPEDIARVKYVLEHYDNVELGSGTKALRDRNGNPAKTVVFSKKINGTYYVVEAVAENKARATRVLTAYLKKSGDAQVTDVRAPVGTSNNGPASTPMTSVPSAWEKVKYSVSGEGESQGDLGAERAKKVAEQNEREAKLFFVKTAAKHQLTPEEKTQVEQLMRGELKTDDLTENRESIEAVYKALNAYEESRLIYNQLVKQYKAIKPGEKPYREVDVPKSTDGKDRVGKTVRTFMEAQATTDELVSMFRDGVLNKEFSYTPKKDKKALTAALHTIEEQGWEGAWDQWQQVVREQRPATKEDIITAQLLYKAAAQAGDLDMASRMAKEMAPVLTQAGQTIQAMRMLKKQTPEGKLYYAEKMAEHISQELREKKSKKTGMKGILSGEDQEFEGVSIPEDLKKALLKAETEQEQYDALDNIYKAVGEQLPPELTDRLNAWRYFAMLGNPRTHIRNVLGNLINKGLLGTRNKASAVGQLTLPRADRTRTLQTNRAYKEWAERDFESHRYMLKGNKYSNDLSGAREYMKSLEISLQKQEAKPVLKTVNKPLQLLQKAADFNSDWLDKEDFAFKKSAYINSLANFLTARDIDPETATEEQLEEARGHAINDALEATFQQYSQLANELSRLERSGKAMGVVVGSLVPFKKTPINIAKQGGRFTPIGIAEGIWNLTHSVKNGDRTAAEAIDHLCNGLSGTAIGVVGAAIAAGILEGVTLIGSDDEDKKQRDFDMAQGSQEYSLVIGDHSYTIDWAAPAVIPILLGAEVYHTLTKERAEDESVVADTISAAGRLMEPLINLTMLSGVSGTIQAAAYGTANPFVTLGGEMVQNYAGQFIPTLFGQVARTVDDTRRTTYYDRNSDVPKGLQNFLQRQGNKIPFASKKQLPWMDAWGRTDRTPNLMLRVFDNFVSPGYLSRFEHSVVDEELQRLHDLDLTTASMLPSKAAADTKVNGKFLDADKYAKLVQTQGRTARSILEELFSSDSYQGLSDLEKSKAVEKVYEFAKEKGKIAVGQSWDGESVESWMRNAETAREEHDIPYSTYVSLYVTKNAIDSDESLDKTTKATMVASEIDRHSELSQTQIQFLKDNIAVFQMTRVEAKNYERGREAGLDIETSTALQREIDALEPLEGAAQVSNAQKYRVVVDAGISEDKQMEVLGSMMQEAEYTRLQVGRQHGGVAPTEYVQFLEMKPLYDEDGNGSFKQAEVTALLKAMNISNSSKAALWQMANKSWKPGKNPFSVAVGSKVYEGLNGG